MKLAQIRNHEVLRLKGALATVRQIRRDSPDVMAEWDDTTEFGMACKGMHLELDQAVSALFHAINWARKRRNPKLPRPSRAKGARQ